MVVSAQGIDVSGFQSPLTTQTLSGLSFAFCKATEGLSIIDAYLSWNWQAIKSAGKVRGAYHELTAAGSAVEQASFFVNTVLPHGVRPGDMFAITAGDRPRITSAMVQACCELVRELVGPHCPVLVHADTSAARSLATCTGFPLWIACEGTPPADVRPWDVWRFWQYSARPTLRNTYNGTAEDLETWIRGYASGASSPPIASQPPGSWQEELMKSLPTLDIGAMMNRMPGWCPGSRRCAWRSARRVSSTGTSAGDAERGPRRPAAVRPDPGTGSSAR